MIKRLDDTQSHRLNKQVLPDLNLQNKHSSITYTNFLLIASTSSGNSSCMK